MARCRKCGSEIHLGEKECSFCFTPLSPAEIAEVEREHNRDNYLKKNAVKFQKEKKRKKMLIVIPIIVAAITLVAVLGYIFRTPIVNTFNKMVNHVSVKEDTEKDKINKIKLVAEDALNYCQGYDISQTQYGSMDEYVTVVTKQKLHDSYPEFDNDVIEIRLTGDKITYVGHNQNSWQLNKAYEVWDIADK